MSKFVEYSFLPREDGDEISNIIVPVETFDIHALHIPAGAVSFHFREGDNPEQAIENMAVSDPYYLLKNGEFWTTDDLGTGSQREQLLYTMVANMRRKNPDNSTFSTLIEAQRKMEAHPQNMFEDIVPYPYLAPLDASIGFMIHILKRIGCSRYISNPPFTIIGIDDSATILDRDTRQELSPPRQKPPILN